MASRQVHGVVPMKSGWHRGSKAKLYSSLTEEGFFCQGRFSFTLLRQKRRGSFLFDAERGSGYEDTACTGRSKNHCGGGRLVLPSPMQSSSCTASSPRWNLTPRARCSAAAKPQAAALIPLRRHHQHGASGHLPRYEVLFLSGRIRPDRAGVFHFRRSGLPGHRPGARMAARHRTRRICSRYRR